MARRKTYSLVALVIAAAIIVVYFVVSLRSASRTGDVTTESEVTSTSPAAPSATTSITFPPPKGSAAGASKDRAWQTLQEYLTRARAHDIAGLKELSYQQSAACADPEKKEACFGLMDDVVELGKLMKENDYVHVWEDGKQIILATAPVRNDSGGSPAVFRGFIYFVKGPSNVLKILYFDPAQGWFYTGGQTDPDFVNRRLNSMVLDTDQDGLTDEQELCTGSYLNESDCTHTDQAVRDTDGDGWWDGVEFYFKK
ncbi:hypothetical protein EPN83_03130 [Patescibacteria group bacterium]|nr:MAG: hypothetical protein EPN83_03130 [Patescibacteria group bacterium]